jgi:hypothetical protein
MFTVTRAGTLALLCGVALLLSCGKQEPPAFWTAWVYPNKADLSVSHSLVGFDSLEHCRQAAITVLDITGKSEAGDYECGFKCRPYLEGISMCERTER